MNEEIGEIVHINNMSRDSVLSNTSEGHRMYTIRVLEYEANSTDKPENYEHFKLTDHDHFKTTDHAIRRIRQRSVDIISAKDKQTYQRTIKHERHISNIERSKSFVPPKTGPNHHKSKKRPYRNIYNFVKNNNNISDLDEKSQNPICSDKNSPCRDYTYEDFVCNHISGLLRDLSLLNGSENKLDILEIIKPSKVKQNTSLPIAFHNKIDTIVSMDTVNIDTVYDYDSKQYYDSPLVNGLLIDKPFEDVRLVNMCAEATAYLNHELGTPRVFTKEFGNIQNPVSKHLEGNLKRKDNPYTPCVKLDIRESAAKITGKSYHIESEKKQKINKSNNQNINAVSSGENYKPRKNDAGKNPSGIEDAKAIDLRVLNDDNKENKNQTNLSQLKNSLDKDDLNQNHNDAKIEPVESKKIEEFVKRSELKSVQNATSNFTFNFTKSKYESKRLSSKIKNDPEEEYNMRLVGKDNRKAYRLDINNQEIYPNLELNTVTPKFRTDGLEGTLLENKWRKNNNKKELKLSSPNLLHNEPNEMLNIRSKMKSKKDNLKKVLNSKNKEEDSEYLSSRSLKSGRSHIISNQKEIDLSEIGNKSAAEEQRFKTPCLVRESMLKKELSSQNITTPKELEQYLEAITTSKRHKRPSRNMNSSILNEINSTKQMPNPINFNDIDLKNKNPFSKANELITNKLNIDSKHIQLANTLKSKFDMFNSIITLNRKNSNRTLFNEKSESKPEKNNNQSLPLSKNKKGYVSDRLDDDIMDDHADIKSKLDKMIAPKNENILSRIFSVDVLPKNSSTHQKNRQNTKLVKDLSKNTNRSIMNESRNTSNKFKLQLDNLKTDMKDLKYSLSPRRWKSESKIKVNNQDSYFQKEILIKSFDDFKCFKESYIDSIVDNLKSQRDLSERSNYVTAQNTARSCKALAEKSINILDSQTKSVRPDYKYQALPSKLNKYKKSDSVENKSNRSKLSKDQSLKRIVTTQNQSKYTKSSGTTPNTKRSNINDFQVLPIYNMKTYKIVDQKYFQ